MTAEDLERRLARLAELAERAQERLQERARAIESVRAELDTVADSLAGSEPAEATREGKPEVDVAQVEVVFK